ncbi:peptidoglycan/xylan/chitin deacetylase (PgdA/CDA1 family) [Hydrogenispora ethanolica]|uniref:Peptidoglycan/xylan/chitin deacetylase (PgdA/CDA1 family) n=1 Tax=Hydrogenispora ethanolica TaxID=1082276 RepID=A0A4R1RFJ2_HYDET|nr:polysaccharide deacetylase family protein [Hydrogenispora ethanolica]TCL64724.1 peptidoglycan/xylan/chitin deacetylase (PgdA/CDA1 family) [Hydrogenispora ethanolica]
MITVKRVQLPVLALLAMVAVLLFTIPRQLINHYLFVRSAIALVDRVDIEWMGYTSQKVVALTFDDGPDPRYTPAILKILAEYKIPATFFLVGTNVRRHPELVRAEIAAGHQVGNHTLSHPHLRRLTLPQIEKQIAATDRAIAEAAGVEPLLFRPPYEELSENILAASRLARKKIVMSTITVEHHVLPTPQQKANRVAKMVFPGAIILAHDGRVNRTDTVAALPEIIRALQAKGYRFVTLTELLQHNR